MDDETINFITNIIQLTDDEISFIKSQNQFETYKKGTLLLSEGELCKLTYFIMKGCIRSYYLIDGEEKTTEFFTEKQGVITISYIKNQPSEYYLICLEDSVVAVSNAERTQKLIENVPKLESLIIQMNGELLAQNQEALDDFKNLNPEMRYLKLLKTRPDLLQRISLFHLASYLGITPESLSRIRKRISTK